MEPPPRPASTRRWREGLLARAVLRGATKGSRQHPQLTRFRQLRSPVVRHQRVSGHYRRRGRHARLSF
ncbi:MAG: pyrimidine dimer DNA glycosylase/endonuclease V [Longimicrobiales bacterium]